MPRDSSGVYRLPAGNPVVPDTIIESVWANTTLDDVATALTGSLPRSGVAPMLGPLTLSADPITQSRQAVSKEYVDSFLAAATGMPLGAITAYATNGVPAGWLLCNGQAVNRTTYAGLFTAIGTIYGSGNGVDTFNVPDLRNEFVRGLGGSSVLGTHYAASLAAHSHGVTDPGHAHNVNANTGVENADHTHRADFYDQPAGAVSGYLNTGSVGQYGAFLSAGGVWSLSNATPNAVLPTAGPGYVSANMNIGNHQHHVFGDTGGISANHTHYLNANTNAVGTGISTTNTGGAETAPQHMVMNYIIKAIEDTPASGTVVTVTVASVVPATAPPFVGAMYVDQALNKVYVATGTAASTDWSLLN